MRYVLGAALAAVLLIGCGGSEPEPTPTPEPTATSTPTEVPTATNTPRAWPTPQSTRTPAPTATISPETYSAFFAAFFWSAYEEYFTTNFPDALESIFWLDTVDRVSFDEPTNTIRVDATVLFESIYLRDPQEWRDDTWELFRLYGRSSWGTMVEVNSDDLPGVDWSLISPALAFYGNAGRLTAHCPGTVLHGIYERQVTQTDFESQCTFSH